MGNNKAILDEAARSVRRTFIGTAAGSVVMLGVVGVAGAYGMPERLTAQAISAAMAKFNVTFAPGVAQVTGPAVAQPVKVAENLKPRAMSPVREVAPDDTIERTVPQAAAPAAPAITPPPAPVAAPRESIVAATPQFIQSEPAAPEPAPAITASLMPRVSPEIADKRPLLSAPMVFEAPKPADAQVLTELPKTEVIAAAPQRVAPVEAPKLTDKAAAMSAMASATATPDLAEFPKSVMVTLPLPKPPLTPAQRLDLTGKDYDKAEKCLAQAVYFEARNEPARGQQAVAQVVLNRVFSPYYPKDVCSVVYQNAHRHLSCQFTFACDGKPESISERGAWARANRVAQQTLAAKVWLPEVNKATHYHASYVRPNWIRDMKVMVRYGLHTFYRPRNWGDGSDEAHWGTTSNSVKAASTAAKPLTPAQKKFAYGRT